jgi:hypothetical protein
MAGVRCGVVFVPRWVYSMQDRARRLYRCYARRRKSRFQECLCTRVRREIQPCKVGFLARPAIGLAIARPLTCARRMSSSFAQRYSQCRAATRVTRVAQLQACESRAAVRCRRGWRSVPLLYASWAGWMPTATANGRWAMIAWRGVKERGSVERQSVKRMEGFAQSDASSQSMCARRIFFTNRARQGVVAHKVCGEVEAAASSSGACPAATSESTSLGTRPRLVSSPAGAGAATGVFEKRSGRMAIKAAEHRFASSPASEMCQRPHI